MLKVLRKSQLPRLAGYCSSSKNSQDNEPTTELPEEPTNCCMSGCANCVWIDYAKQITKIYADGGSKAQKLILKKISDPNLKVFLKMELRTIGKANTE